MFGEPVAEAKRLADLAPQDSCRDLGPFHASDQVTVVPAVAAIFAQPRRSDPKVDQGRRFSCVHATQPIVPCSLHLRQDALGRTS